MRELKRGWLVLALYIFATGVINAREGGGFFSTAGGGQVFSGAGQTFSASRSARTDDGRFWSQLYTGPWAFVEAGSLEFSVSLVIGRVTRENRWCFPIMAVNTGVLWRMPFSVAGFSPLVGVGLDSIFWARYRCVRSDYTLSSALPGSPFREFSAFTFKLGTGRDFYFADYRFFRARLLAYYGRRRPDNPDPLGGILRLGVGRWL